MLSLRLCKITNYSIITESHRTTHLSTDWVNCINRGALQHADDITFSLLAAMELEFQRNTAISDVNATKNKAMDGILENGAVCYNMSQTSRQLRQIKFTMRTSKALNKNRNRKDKDTPMEAKKPTFVTRYCPNAHKTFKILPKHWTSVYDSTDSPIL